MSNKRANALVDSHLANIAALAKRVRKDLHLGFETQNDLENEGWLGAREACDGYKEDAGGFWAWAAWRVNGRMRDWARKQRRGYEELTEMPDKVIAIDQQIRVRKAVERLPAVERRVVEEIYWKGKTQAELAKEMRVSQPWVSEKVRDLKRDLGRTLISAKAA